MTRRLHLRRWIDALYDNELAYLQLCKQNTVRNRSPREAAAN